MILYIYITCLSRSIILLEISFSLPIKSHFSQSELYTVFESPVTPNAAAHIFPLKYLI